MIIYSISGFYKIISISMIIIFASFWPGKEKEKKRGKKFKKERRGQRE